MATIRVELEALSLTHHTMVDYVDEYMSTYSKMLSLVDELSLYWQGKDQIAFSNQIHEFEPTLVSLGQLLEKYCHYLEKSIEAYRLTQDDTEKNSYRLLK